jgi:hypothetical protein
MVQHQHIADLIIDRIRINSLTLRCSIPIRIPGIPIPKGKSLPPRSSDRPHIIIVIPERRAHKRGSNTNDPREGLFHAEHRVVDLRGAERVEVGVGPGVRADHVPRVVGVFDACDGVGGIDAVIVVAVEEEGAFCACIR